MQSTAVLSRALCWDNHACMPLREADVSFMGELERYRRSGWDAVTLNVGYGPQPVDAHVRALAAFRRWIRLHDDRYVLVDDVDDLDDAARRGRLAVSFDVEGMAVLAPDRLEFVSLFYDLGVRWMLVAYNLGNACGGGCLDASDGGLTSFGRDVLREMKRVGMVVCCSHTGSRTAWDVLESAENPVIFSHSNCAAVWPHRRNIPDDLIRACAATGGYVGINGYGPFLGDNDNSTEAWLRHIDHVVQLVGPEHAALGSDFVFDASDLDAAFKSMPEYYAGYDTATERIRMVEPERLQFLVDGLMRLGYGEGAIESILGGNVLRVARQVWR